MDRWPIFRAGPRTAFLRGPMDFLPGGYTFTHLIFWSVVGLVAIGTNAVAIMLSIGMGLLAMESVKKDD